MAALIRSSSNVRLSLIAGAFSRLRLQHAGSPTIPRPSAHFRGFSQTRHVLLENLAGVNLKTTLDNDHSPTKPTGDLTTMPLPEQPKGTGRKVRTLRKFDPPSVKWTEEEDRELFRLVKEGKSTYYIYENHFRHRSHGAVGVRVNLALKAAKLQEEQVSRGVREGEEDVSKLAAGVEGAAPLRVVYRQIVKTDKEQRETNKTGDGVQRRDQLRIKLFGQGPVYKGRWTPEEDALLEQLVHEFADTPQPSLWHKVSGGKVGESTLLRSVKSCARRWNQLSPPPGSQTGPWTAEEERRLQEAISEQLGGKYQVAVGVLGEGYAAEGMSPGKWRPVLDQLPSQSDLPILQQGSRQLRMLSWVAIEEKVGTRTEDACRLHFYVNYHNGNRGEWSIYELMRKWEAMRLFGTDKWKIVEHVGTRSIAQVSDSLRPTKTRVRREPSETKN
ncbi:hypothetical protein BGX23_003938 [Mortierella sp. AD031]|nr:hypothetical protein BGX23_003938 [Mortierella sp. AD031]